MLIMKRQHSGVVSGSTSTNASGCLLQIWSTGDHSPHLGRFYDSRVRFWLNRTSKSLPNLGKSRVTSRKYHSITVGSPLYCHHRHDFNSYQSRVIDTRTCLKNHYAIHSYIYTFICSNRFFSAGNYCLARSLIKVNKTIASSTRVHA